MKAAFEMIGGAETVADIGCDHGFLSAALVVSGRAGRAIASDISEASAAKAERLAEALGISARMKTAAADGLAALEGIDPPYKIAVCGMGGELIARILDRESEKAKKASLIVMQPMRGEAELRRYLFENGYRIEDERVVLDEGRYYQLISAVPNADDEIPEGFPKGYFRFGWVMASKPEPLLLPLLRHYRAVYLKELQKAEAQGRRPGRIVDEIANTDALITFVNAHIKQEKADASE